MSRKIDEIDKKILSLLQDNARINNSEIADRVGVSPSTVGKHIKKLERSGIIKGYYPTINYDTAGFPHRVLFICTTAISEREALIDEVLDISGVVNAMELMTGENNIHIQVVGKSNEDISELAFTISDLGVRIKEEVLVKSEYSKPASVFK